MKATAQKLKLFLTPKVKLGITLEITEVYSEPCKKHGVYAKIVNGNRPNLLQNLLF